MTTEQRNLRITNEHNGDGTHNQKAANTIKPLLGLPSSYYTGPTTQTDVTASRALDTVYQNTTGKPMWVIVRVSEAASYADIHVQTYTDASNPPVLMEDEIYTNTAFNPAPIITATIRLIVLPNNYYKVVNVANCALTGWIEKY